MTVDGSVGIRGSCRTFGYVWESVLDRVLEQLGEYESERRRDHGGHLSEIPVDGYVDLADSDHRVLCHPDE